MSKKSKCKITDRVGWQVAGGGISNRDWWLAGLVILGGCAAIEQAAKTASMSYGGKDYVSHFKKV